MKKSDLKDGMVVKLRGGDLLVAMDSYLFNKDYNQELELDEYSDDLLYCNDKYKHFDIVEVYENIRPFVENNCEFLWKREEVDWNKVPFGTKVLVWDFKDQIKMEGKFIRYDEVDDSYKFVVLVENEPEINWRYCELAEYPKEEITYDTIYVKFIEKCKNIDSCKVCEYHHVGSNCGFAWLLENYNVTRK